MKFNAKEAHKAACAYARTYDLRPTEKEQAKFRNLFIAGARWQYEQTIKQTQ